MVKKTHKETALSTKRNAQDLADVLTLHPFLVNELDRVDDFFPEDAPDWEQDPRTLLPAARLLMVKPVGENGNFLV